MSFSIPTFFVVFIAYISSFALVSGFIAPLQSILLPNLSTLASLVFLPHGVRVLAFYFLGWRAFLYLLPASSLMWAVDFLGKGIELQYIGVITSLIASYLGVLIVRRAINEPETSYVNFSWRHAITAGAIGSLMNSAFNWAGISWLPKHEIQPITIASYWIGDIAGQFVMMIILIFTFKYIEKASGAAE
jgi:hypothetical protein